MDGGHVSGLHLGGNGLRGEIPAEIGRLTQLRELWFGDGNNITGEFPSEVSKLTRLEVLDLGYSEMRGAIPAWLGDLGRLMYLYLDGNQFEGEVPAELGNLTRLELLTLHNSPWLSGALPTSLMEIPNLYTLTFDRTRMCAPLDERFQAWIRKIPDYNGTDCFPDESEVNPLEITVPPALTSIGERVQLSVSVRSSDGVRQTVESAIVQWETSDAAVVTVIDGEVTASGPGNATVTALYDGHETEAPISVRISTRKTGTVRVLYASPSDREFRADYSEGITNALVDLQSWYRRELGGLTFSLYDVTPQHCRMKEPSAYYARGNSWEKVETGVQHCAHARSGDPDFVWVVYADVEEACDEPYELGAGGGGMTIVPRWDLEGVANSDVARYCEGPQLEPPGRWIGGIGHELGHTMGLPHPPGCDDRLPTCDESALMSWGYSTYPDTYFRSDDKETLLRSQFIHGTRSPVREPIDPPGISRIRGAVLAFDGEPIEGIRVSAVSEDYWNWGQTDVRGGFEIPVTTDSEDPYVLSVHAGQTADCRWFGYHGRDGLTSIRADAARFEVGDVGVNDVEISVPSVQYQNCAGSRIVAGTVLGPGGSPVEGIRIESAGVWAQTGRDGAFEFPAEPPWPGSIAPNSFNLRIHVDEVANCGFVGYYGPGGFTTLKRAATLELGGVSLTGIKIILPAEPSELCDSGIKVSGTLLGPSGDPVEGVFVELNGDWEWSETDRDGNFEIGVLEGRIGWSVISIVSPYCRTLGYYDEHRGFLTSPGDATLIELGDDDVTGIEIKLPKTVDELCDD